MSQFDHYQISADISPDHAIGELLERLELSDYENTRPVNGYKQCVVLRRAERTICRVQWGGNTGNLTQLKTSGEGSHDVTKVIRDLVPVHKVQRVDVCDDFSSEGVFSTLADWAMTCAEEFNVKVNHMGDWYRAEKGRTLTVGSRESVGYMRIYEKGIESKSGDLHHARAELEIKPAKQTGWQCADWEPEKYWGVSRWSQHFASVLFGRDMEVARLNRVWSKSDTEKAFEYMLKQYGATIARMVDLKGWDYVQEKLREAVSLHPEA
tara:strand:- start:167 stop:964 length:798 start_codon:yes stop_codon:yes gene_type:complete